MIHITHTPTQTEELGAQLARQLAPGAVVALFGDLGAGKTAFVRGLAQGLGMADDDITSPTYALVHEHNRLVHFDMYRVAGAEDLESTGWYDYLGGEKVLAIEWSENITDELPSDAIRVHIETINENERRITIAHLGD